MSDTATRRSGYLYQITIIGILFFIFGFVTWLNGTLIPFLKLACGLQYDWQALLVTFAFYISYFFLAIPSSQILKRTGFKNGMALGLLVMAVGCLLFIPAANARAFPLFLTGLFVQGMGLSILQTASNPYISILGPIESAAQRISIMGICNKVAGILSPLILSTIVLKNANAIEAQVLAATDAATKAGLLNELAGRVVMPYVVMALVLGALAFMIRRSALPEIDIAAEEQVEGDASLSAGRTSIWQFPHLLLGALAIFFYVGAEVMAGDVIGIYGKATGKFSLEEISTFTSFTLTAMLLGYVLGIFLIPKVISQQHFLKYSAITGILLTLGVFFTAGWAWEFHTTVSLFGHTFHLAGNAVTMCIALLGLANAVMWPAIFPLAINGLGRFTQIGSALLIMGIAGGALLPQLFGYLKELDAVGYQMAFQITILPCYFYILYYAVSGYKPK